MKIIIEIVMKNNKMKIHAIIVSSDIKHQQEY
jgi:hypothetical protein